MLPATSKSVFEWIPIHGTILGFVLGVALFSIYDILFGRKVTDFVGGVRLCEMNPRDVVPLDPRSVYFDLGANNGDSITTFLREHPPAEKWDVVLIEANPIFTTQLIELCASSGARSCLPLVETALTTYDGYVDIFIDETRLEHDASTIEAKAFVADESKRAGVFNATALDVLTLFTSTFAVHEEDFVAVKIDIEGSEFPVVTRAIARGLLPLWDTLNVEWHDSNPFIFGRTGLAQFYSAQRVFLLNVIKDSKVVMGEWYR